MGIPQGRLEFHFLNWRRYMQKDSVGEGYPRKASGFVGGGYSASFEDLVDSADSRCASVVDAVIGGLPTVEQWAVHSEYLGARLRMDYELFCCALDRAKRKVATGLWERGIY